MTNTEKALIIVSAALVVLIAVGAYFYVEQVRNLAKAEAYSAAKDEVISKLNASIKDAQSRMDKRDADWQEQEKLFEKQLAEIKTQDQARKALAESGAPTVEVAREQLPANVQQQLPDAKSYTVITPDEAVRFARSLVEADRLKGEVDKLTNDNVDLRGQLKDAQQAQKETESKAHEWKNAAHGGTWARRSVSALKWGAISGGIVYVAVKVFHRK
jgi:hypothetical protein